MNGTPFPESNAVLGPPQGMSDAECAKLPVFRDGTHVISRWEPSDDDRSCIAAGGPIWLWVWGKSMPPVALTTDRPFTEEDDNGPGDAEAPNVECKSPTLHDALDPVRAWYDGDGEITNDTELVAAIVEDLQHDRAQAHMIQELLGCTGHEVTQTVKSLKEAARIGTNARVEIGRLRADVQDAVDTGKGITVSEILARLDGIVEPSK